MTWLYCNCWVQKGRGGGGEGVAKKFKLNILHKQYTVGMNNINNEFYFYTIYHVRLDKNKEILLIRFINKHNRIDTGMLHTLNTMDI